MARNEDPFAVTFAGKARKRVPFEFVLEALAELRPRTNPMFGCLAVYVGARIVLILRERPTATADNGVWLATTAEHHESLRREFPRMRSIGVLGKDVTGWQVLPADAPDFEETALRACELVIAGDANRKGARGEEEEEEELKGLGVQRRPFLGGPRRLSTDFSI